MLPHPGSHAANVQGSSTSYSHALHHGKARPIHHPAGAACPLALSPSDLTRIYDWAGHPNAAVLCFARDIRRIKVMDSVGMVLGGLTLYRHLNTPCLQATVCGIIVGVTVKERKIIYEIDDGTAVLRVHAVENGPDAEQQQRPAKRRGSERSTQPTGIPSCYLMPAFAKPQKHGSRGAARYSRDSAASSSSYDAKARHEVGELVRVTGSIKPDYDNDRILTSSIIVTLHDPNDESRHFLKAIRLAEEEYCLPLTQERVRQLTRAVPESLQADSTEIPWDTHTRDAGGAGSDHSDVIKSGKSNKQRLPAHHLDKEQGRNLRRLISPPTSEPATPRPMPHTDLGGHVDRSTKLENARRLLSSSPSAPKADDVAPSMHQRSPDGSNVARANIRPLSLLNSSERWIGADSSDVERHGSRQPIYRSEGARGCCSRRQLEQSPSPEPRRTRESSVSSFASSTGSTSRRLRKHQKLPDAKVTETYFRLQVQQYLADRHAEAQGDGFTSSSLGGSLPRPFSVTDLAVQRDLRELAERLVRIKLARRGKARAESLDVRASSLSSESVADKVQRLFQWCIRQMMTDGFIMLAGAVCGPEPSEVIDLTELPPSSGGGIVHKKDEETYRVVTSEVLAEPILAVLRRSRSQREALDTDGVLGRLARMDDSFSSLTTEAAESALYDLWKQRLISRSAQGEWRAT
ncbi:hypothetical protein ACQY0O_004443 [Thecaphora frezii]